MERADERSTGIRRRGRGAWFGWIALVLSIPIAAVFVARALEGLMCWPRMPGEWWITGVSAFAGGLLLILSSIGFAHARSIRSDARTLGWSIGLLILAGGAYAVELALDTPERAVRNAQPLVDAIRRYQADRRAPPDRLESLVPSYLAEVPIRFTRTFQLAHYDREPSSPLGWRLQIGGFPGWSVEMMWLEYEPGIESVVRRQFDTAEPRQIGNWVLHESSS